MVSQKYRWDFIGLSTDEKPTSETSDKVVNGSTYYCSDTSKLYVYCDGTWYERKPLGGGGGGGGTSDFNDLSNRPKYNGSDMTGSTNIPEVKTYTAGSNVSISDQNVISATDTTYSNFTGTDGTAAGTAGLVPAPATTDVGKFLKADGTWDTAGGGSGPTVVQSTGSSTTDVMSQNAVTSMVFVNPEDNTPRIRIGNTNKTSTYCVNIGYNSYANSDGGISLGASSNTGGSGDSIAIGNTSRCHGKQSISIGFNASQTDGLWGAISLGSSSKATRDGEMNIGTLDSAIGFNSSNYRLISGVYDGQSAHDAATVAQGNTLSSSAPTTSTVGVLGQLWTDTTNMHTYQCTAISGNTYTWTQRW